MLVSVCMIVRNEESNLNRALQSIPSSFERIVVDTGSTDHTLEIALKQGAKVGYYHWSNDFAAARNYSVSLASGNYILILDADETLCDDTEKQIKRFIEVQPKQAGAVNIENRIGNEVHKHRMVRFFPNDRSYSFQGIVHESLYLDGMPADFVDTNITVYHYGYQEELYAKGEKANRYLELYHQHLTDHPEDGYMLYQLGKLHFSMGEHQNALNAFERCLEVNEQNKLYYPVMLVMLGYTLKDIGEFHLAEQLLEPFLNQYPDYPDLPFFLGLLAMETGKINDIEFHFLRALQIGESAKYSSVIGVGSFKATYNLGVYYEVTGNMPKALEYYRNAASFNYDLAQERLEKINQNH